MENFRQTGQDREVAPLAQQFQDVREGRASAFMVIYGGGFIETTEEVQRFAQDLVQDPLNAGITEVVIFAGGAADVEEDILSRSGNPARVIAVPPEALDSLERYWELTMSDIDWDMASPAVTEEYMRLHQEVTEKLI